MPVRLFSDKARETWSSFVVDERTFTNFLHARPSARLAHAADLWLACACLAGVRRAHAELDRVHLSRVRALIGSLARRVDPDEVRQRLTIKLLMGTRDRGPRLEDYKGHGALSGWLRVSACRVALDLSRATREEELAPIEWLVHTERVDPQTSLLHERFCSEFSSALHQSLQTLEPAYRSMLRKHYLEGATTASLADEHQVSRNTVVRKIADARSSVFDATMRETTQRLGIPWARRDVILQVVRPRIDATVLRMLALE